MSRSFRFLIWYLFLPAFLIVLVYPPKIHGYLNPYDEGLWLGLAQAFIDGKTLYRDVFFHYGPVIPWILQCAMHHVAPTLTTIRAVFWILNVLALLMIHACFMRVLRGPWLRLVFSFCLWSVPLTAPVLTIPMAARYGIPFASILFWSLDSSGKRQNTWALCSGLFAGLAFWVSQEVGTAVTIGGLFYYLLGRRRKSVGAFVMGEALVSFIMVLGLGMMGLKAYKQCAVSETAVMFFSNAFPFPGWKGNLLDGARQGIIPFIVALRSDATSSAALLPMLSYIILFIWTLYRRLTRRSWDRFALALAIYGSLTAVTAWTQPDRWHIYFALTPALLLWGYSLSFLKQPRMKIVAGSGVMIVALFLTLPHVLMAWQKERLAFALMGRSSIPRAGISRIPAGQADGYESLVQEIDHLIPKDQQFLFYPYDGSIYFLADRTNPTFFPVLALAVNASLQERVVREITSPKVQWVIQDTEDNAFRGIPIDTFLAPIAGYIKNHFVLKASLGPFRFLKRVDTSGYNASHE